MSAPTKSLKVVRSDTAKRPCFDNEIDVFLTSRRPPETPDSWSPRTDLTGIGPGSLSGRVVEEMASETTFFNQTNNLTKPLNLPFADGFHFPRQTTILLFRNARSRKNKSVLSISVWETMVC